MEEYLDVLDEDGNKTGKTKLRSKVHRDGDWHAATHIWILNSDKELLIQKRSLEKDTHPNYWDISAAGHISAGDEIEDSARREIKEELGLDIKPTELKHLYTYKQEYNSDGVNNKQLNYVYLLEKDIDTSKLVLQKSEVSEVKFIPYQKLAVLSMNGILVPHPEEHEKILEVLNERFK
jgi:isopentenyl-diphosphate delta-isomerase